MADFVKINTLTITTENNFSKNEYEFLLALSYLINSLKGQTKNNVFCMYIKENSFLIADHNKEKDFDPFAFINEKGEILFKVNINVFTNAIKEFEKYKKDCIRRHPELPDEKILQKTIIEYKNDKLDFYSNCRIVQNKIIETARNLYEETCL